MKLQLKVGSLKMSETIDTVSDLRNFVTYLVMNDKMSRISSSEPIEVSSDFQPFNRMIEKLGITEYGDFLAFIEIVDELTWEYRHTDDFEEVFKKPSFQKSIERWYGYYVNSKETEYFEE